MEDTKDLEFGLIDNDGNLNLIDDEENTTNNYSDDGMSFESLIGDPTESEANDASYSTSELRDLTDMINLIDDNKNRVEDNFDQTADLSVGEISDNNDTELDSVDAKTVDLENLGLEKIKDEEPKEEKEVTDNTISLADLNLEQDVTIDNVEVEPIEEEVVDTKEEEKPIKEEVVDTKEEEKEEPVANVVDNNDDEAIVVSDNFHDTIELTGDLKGLSNALSEEDVKIEELATPLEEEINVSEDYNIDEILDKASKNAKEASTIFSQNLELRKQIDEKYNKLVKLTEEQEAAKKQALTEIEDYKNEVYIKLKDQKTEVETKIEELKQLQSTMEKEKADFIEYRKSELDKITAMQKEFEQQRNEIISIEEKLVLRKQNVDAEREKLKAEKEQFEIEKRNLKANLKKFNELVGGFTGGLDQVTSTGENQ